MSDDLDELKRVCNEKTRWPTCGEVLALIERCRKAEAEAEKRYRVGIEEMNAKEKAWVERDELRAQLARWPEAVAKVRERYDEKIFPANGVSLECSSAAFARGLCDEIVDLATALEAGKEEDDGTRNR